MMDQFDQEGRGVTLEPIIVKAEFLENKTEQKATKTKKMNKEERKKVSTEI